MSQALIESSCWEDLHMQCGMSVPGEIQPGDHIVEIDGKSVASSRDVCEKMCGCDIPGSQVSLLIRRADSVRPSDHSCRC